MKSFSFVALWLVKFYRVFLSLHFGGACRFFPSCSCYAETVFRSHSPWKASVLVIKRLSKCHFLGPFGLDDPPPVCKEKKNFFIN